MKIPGDLKYTPTHEWVRVEEELATVGITDHAQEELTDVVYLELPKSGREVAAGDQVGVIESVKSASDLYAPVSGEILEVNESLADEPDAVNTDPYGEGWMYRIRLNEAGRGEWANLMDAKAYESLIAKKE